MVYTAHPELETATSGNETIKQQIEEAVFEAWNALDEAYIESLVKSMSRHVEAVLHAKGSYTKY